MGRYDRYILSQLLILFSFFSLVLVSVYWVNSAVGLFDRLIGDGQSLRVFLEFSALSMPQIILLVVPVSGFVAAIYVTNRMISESELVVMQTAGCSALRLLRPVWAFGLIIAVLVAVLAHLLVPAARGQLMTRSVEVSADLTGRLLREGEFIHPTTGVTVYIRDITELGEFRDVFLQDRSQPGTETTYTAQRALLVSSQDGPRLVMFEGIAQTLQTADGRLSIVEFSDFTYDIAGLIEAPGGRLLHIRELPTSVLLFAPAAYAEAQGSTLAAFRFAGHDRLAKPFYALFVPVIAAATLMLGAFSRFGIWPQILLAILLMVPLQMSWNVAESVGARQAGMAWLAWLQPALTMLTAAIMTTLAMRGHRRPRTEGAAPA
ncbi:LPS export ABC transporter permease LptF [Rhodobacteraceae bacterium W635]|uniref:LPS export ABC transporter permease LptF n=1 Tax=Nioella halotolerans TaxID=2303578 RepID=UPI000E3DA87F|nr:LPS export ABC transporter permease LptF [Rhodobacteraceae bacterium W635]